VLRHGQPVQATGRTTPTGILPVGEALPFFIEPNPPPPWSNQDPQSWQAQMGNVLRLWLTCVREGYEPWVLATEHTIGDGGITWTVPAAVFTPRMAPKLTSHVSTHPQLEE
jgi:hypothetical protein